MHPNRLILTIGAIVLVAGGLLAGSLAFAQDEAPAAAITPEQASVAALASVPGTVVEVEMEDEDGVTTYEVEIRPQDGGRVVEVLVDATSGAVLGTEVDDDDEGPFGGLDDLFGDDD